MNAGSGRGFGVLSNQMNINDNTTTQDGSSNTAAFIMSYLEANQYKNEE